MQKRESELENKCCIYARQLGIASVKIEGNGNVGVPDRLFVKKGGNTLFVEFKRPDGKGVISEAQNYWAEFIGTMSHHFISDFETFKVVINTFNLMTWERKPMIQN